MTSNSESVNIKKRFIGLIISMHGLPRSKGAKTKNHHKGNGEGSRAI